RGLSRGMRTSSLRETLRESATELRTNRTLLALILVAVSVEIFAFSYWTALPEVATQRLGMDAEGLSYLNAARALGGLAAGIALAWTIDLRRGRAYLCVIFGFGVSLIFFASAPTLLACALAVLCLGALESGVDVLNQGMMQACVPDALRGRAMGAWSLAIGVAPLGNLQMGTLAAHFGAGTALQIHGAALLGVAALAALWIPRLRRL
ncbi:MAG: MFS transporter, partial [Myxococcales bacterium]|nr:MFS transporter [Myxococcales bacterium]